LRNSKDLPTVASAAFPFIARFDDFFALPVSRPSLIDFPATHHLPQKPRASPTLYIHVLAM
jgi:hypothetical protein